MRLAEDSLGIRGCQRTRVSQMADKGKQEVLGSKTGVLTMPGRIRYNAVCLGVRSLLQGKTGCMVIHTSYKFLEQRPGSNYQQLFLRGRNLLAEILYRATIGLEPRTPDEVAHDYDIPREAVEEAVDYCLRHADILQRERQDILIDIGKRGLDKPPCVPADGVSGA